jgi:anti-anti-sigma regulatory factor
MLRINYSEADAEQTWTLHGRLAGPWTVELKSLWENIRDGRAGSHSVRVTVDLRDVTFIDECGEEVLRAMKREGARFLTRGVDTQDMVARLHDKISASFRKSLCRSESKERSASQE